jgi:hypothetical protein
MDAWFDLDSALLDHRSSPTGKTIREWLERAMLANRYILSIIAEARHINLKGSMNGLPLEDYCAKIQALEDPELIPVDFNFVPYFQEDTPLHLIRDELRDQLNRCLIHLEELGDGKIELYETNFSVGELGRFDAYHCFYFLAMYVRRCLEQLDESMSNYKRYAEKN